MLYIVCSKYIMVIIVITIKGRSTKGHTGRSNHVLSKCEELSRGIA